MIDTIGTHNEGGSFILNDSLKTHLPQMLNLLRNLVKYDNTTRFTKFNSQVYIVTKIAMVVEEILALDFVTRHKCMSRIKIFS